MAGRSSCSLSRRRTKDVEERCFMVRGVTRWDSFDIFQDRDSGLRSGFLQMRTGFGMCGNLHRCRVRTGVLKKIADIKAKALRDDVQLVEVFKALPVFDELADP